MKITPTDVFLAFYETFRKLEQINPGDEPELVASNVEVEIYKEKVAKAEKEVEKTLEEGSQLLEKYVDNRIKKIINRMKESGTLK